MKEQRAESGPYEDWGAIMEALLRSDSVAKQTAFLKLNRLISGFLAALQAWDHRGEWEDLRQTVLMKLVKSFCRGQLRESKAFVTYARTITRHEFYDFLKARGDTTVVESPELEAEEAREETREGETALAMRSALHRLPEEQQRAIQAVYLDGRTYEEAATATGIPLGSLKRYLRLGLGQLRAQLAGVLQGG